MLQAENNMTDNPFEEGPSSLLEDDDFLFSGYTAPETESVSPLFNSPTSFLASLFPLAVLILCLSAICSSGSRGATSASAASLLLPAALFRAFCLHIALLRHHLRSIRYFSFDVLSPPFFLCCLSPIIAFLFFDVLPQLFSVIKSPVPPAAVSVTYPLLFSAPATVVSEQSLAAAAAAAARAAAASAQGGSGIGFAPLRLLASIAARAGFQQESNAAFNFTQNSKLAATGGNDAPDISQKLPFYYTFSPLLRFLLHPFFFSQVSVLFWLVVVPFLLYGLVLHVFIHFRDAALTASAAAAAVRYRIQPQPQHSSSREFVQLLIHSPFPSLKGIIAVAFCFYLPAVFAVLGIHFFANPGSHTLQSFKYVGVEGAIYALTFLVAFYDPIAHSGMFTNSSVQYSGPFHIRQITSILTFLLFLFSPPPFDLYHFFAGAAAAVVAVAAAATPPVLMLTVSAVAAAAAVMHPAKLLLSKLTDAAMATEATQWTVGGVCLSVAAAIVLTSLMYNKDSLIRAIHQSFTRSSGKRRMRAAAVLCAFILIPFSYSKVPSLLSLFLSPRQAVWDGRGRTLYDITCNGSTALGTVAAKVIVYIIPFISLQNRLERLKYVVAPLLCFLLFIGMETEKWQHVGPHILPTVLSAYLLFSL